MKLPTEVINGVEAQPVIDVSMDGCSTRCIYHNKDCCFEVGSGCFAEERKDNNDVYFVKVGE